MTLPLPEVENEGVKSVQSVPVFENISSSVSENSVFIHFDISTKQTSLIPRSRSNSVIAVKPGGYVYEATLRLPGISHEKELPKLHRAARIAAQAGHFPHSAVSRYRSDGTKQFVHVEFNASPRTPVENIPHSECIPLDEFVHRAEHVATRFLSEFE